MKKVIDPIPKKIILKELNDNTFVGLLRFLYLRLSSLISVSFVSKIEKFNFFFLKNESANLLTFDNIKSNFFILRK